jgi:hypothetical protein
MMSKVGKINKVKWLQHLTDIEPNLDVYSIIKERIGSHH